MSGTQFANKWQKRGNVFVFNFSKDIIVYLQQKTETQYAVMLKLCSFGIPKILLQDINSKTLSEAKAAAVSYANIAYSEQKQRYIETKAQLKRKLGSKKS